MSSKRICDRIPTSSPTHHPTPGPTVPGATQAPTAVDVSVGYEVLKSAGGSLLENDYSTLAELAVGDDDVLMLKLPFPFNFYGKYYDYGYLSGNGLLSFASGCDADFNDCSQDIDVTSIRNLQTVRTPMSDNNRINSVASVISDDVKKLASDVTHIVVLKRKSSRSNIDELLTLLRKANGTMFSLEISEVLYGLRMVVIHRASVDALAFLKLHMHVAAVRLSREVTVTEIPQSRRPHKVTGSSVYSWGLDRIDQADLPLDNKAYKPSSASGSGKGVSVFVLDTGIDTNHIEFTTDSSREVKNLYNYFGSVTTDTDGAGHGIHSCVMYYI